MNNSYFIVALLIALAPLHPPALLGIARTGTEDSSTYQEQFQEALNAIKEHDAAKLKTILNKRPSLATIQDSQGKTLMHHAASSIAFPESKYEANLKTFVLPLFTVPFSITLILKNVPGIKMKVLALGALFYAVYKIGSQLYNYAFGDTVKETYSDYHALMKVVGSYGHENNDVLDNNDKSPVEYALKTHSLEVIELLEAQGKGGKIIHQLAQPLTAHFEQWGTAPPEKSRIVLFGEDHGDLESIVLNYKAIETLAKPGDAILVEGEDFNNTGPIDIVKDISNSLQIITGSMLDDRLETTLNKAVNRSSLASKVSAYGWENGTDDALFYAAAATFFASSIALPLLFSPTTLLIITTALLALGYSDFFDKTGIGKMLSKTSFQAALPFLVTNRNENMVKALDTLDAQLPADSTIFVVAGALHLPLPFEGNDLCSSHTKSLAKYLEEKRYAIMLPKKLYAECAQSCGIVA